MEHLQFAFWIYLASALGGVVGFMLAASLAAGKVQDLYEEIALLERQRK